MSVFGQKLTPAERHENTYRRLGTFAFPPFSRNSWRLDSVNLRVDDLHTLLSGPTRGELWDNKLRRSPWHGLQPAGDRNSGTARLGGVTVVRTVCG